MKFKDIFGREIRLSSEVWDHILKTHPELKGKLDRIKETLISPEIIKRGVLYMLQMYCCSTNIIKMCMEESIYVSQLKY